MNLVTQTNKALNQLGYRALALPKSELDALTIFRRGKGQIGLWGSPSSVFEIPNAGVIPPVTHGNVPAITAASDSSLDANIAAEVVGSFLGAAADAIAKIGLSIKHAASVSITFSGIEEQKALPADISAFATASTLRFAPGSGALFDAAKGDDFFIAVSVLRAHKISISAKDSHGASITLNLPVIQGIAGGSAAVNVTGNNSAAVTFEDPVYSMVFAVRLDQILFDDWGIFQDLRPNKDLSTPVRN